MNELLLIIIGIARIARIARIVRIVRVLRILRIARIFSNCIFRCCDICDCVLELRNSQGSHRSGRTTKGHSVRAVLQIAGQINGTERDTRCPTAYV